MAFIILDDDSILRTAFRSLQQSIIINRGRMEDYGFVVFVKGEDCGYQSHAITDTNT